MDKLSQPIGGDTENEEGGGQTGDAPALTTHTDTAKTEKDTSVIDETAGTIDSHVDPPLGFDRDEVLATQEKTQDQLETVIRRLEQFNMRSKLLLSKEGMS